MPTASIISNEAIAAAEQDFIVSIISYRDFLALSAGEITSAEAVEQMNFGQSWNSYKQFNLEFRDKGGFCVIVEANETTVAFLFGVPVKFKLQLLWLSVHDGFAGRGVEAAMIATLVEAIHRTPPLVFFVPDGNLQLTSILKDAGFQMQRSELDSFTSTYELPGAIELHEQIDFGLIAGLKRAEAERQYHLDLVNFLSGNAPMPARGKVKLR